MTRTATRTPDALTAIFSAGFLGGSELFNLEYLREAVTQGVQVHAIVPSEGALAAALRPLCQSVNVVGVPARLTALSRFDARPSARRAAPVVADAWRYGRRLRNVIATTRGPVCAFGFRAQMIAGVLQIHRSRHVLWVVHEVVPRSAFGRVWSFFSRFPLTVFAYSQAAGRQPLLDGAATRIIPPTFDLSAFQAQSAPESPPLTLGLVGDLFPLKNHAALIETVTALNDRGHDVHGLLVGRRNESRPALTAYAADVERRVNETRGRVALRAVDPSEMPTVMGNIDALLHLSTEPESFGRVCVEAMAAARPVIGFDHGGVREIVRSGATGWLVPPGDIDAVIDRVQALLLDPAGFAAMSASAAREVSRRFDVRNGQPTIGHALAAAARDDRDQV